MRALIARARAFLEPLVQLVTGDPVANVYERVQADLKALAREVAEAEYHRHMAGFYTERVLELDPHQSWWDFASAKQAQHDNQRDCLVHEARSEEARARLAARRKQFDQLSNQQKEE